MSTKKQLEPPRGPSIAAWERMTPSQKARLEEDLCVAAVTYERALMERMSEAERLAMGESEEHHDACHDSREALRAFFRRAGGSLYIASNLPVYYPDEPYFAPDLLAVRGVSQRRRSAYHVAAEGKGLDLAIEILFHGDRKKDLRDNVERYARLGIPEYFVVDLRRRRIHGYHLATATAREYAPLLGDGGRFHSQVLGLDLTLLGEELRFYAGTALVPFLTEEVARLTRQATEAAEQAANAEEQAAGALDESRLLREDLAGSILTILTLRGLSVTEEIRRRVLDCQHSDLLRRWLARAASAKLDEIFLDT